MKRIRPNSGAKAADVFDGADLGGANTYHVLANLDASILVANTDASLAGNASHLFA